MVISCPKSHTSSQRLIVVLLQQAVESVLSQDFDDFELLIPTTPVAMELMNTLLPFLIPFSMSDTTRWGFRTTNMGIEMATGEFVAFLDDDDVWLPSKLSRQCRLC